MACCKVLKYLVIPFIFLTLSLNAINVGELNQNNDHGFWFEENIHKDFKNNWLYYLHFEERWGNDYKTLWYFEHWSILHYDLSSQIRKIFCLKPDSIFKSFSIGPGFAQGWTLNKNTKGVFHWSEANRPEIAAFVTLQWNGWQLQERIVAEYWRYITKHYHSFVYSRLRTWVNSPWKFTCFKINPFFANEFFLREKKSNQTGVFYENRFRIGVNAEFFEHFTGSLWWKLRSFKQIQNDKQVWFNNYILGLTLNLNF